MAESLSVLDVDDQHCDLCVAGWARLHRFSFEHIARRRPPLLIARLVQEKISCVFMRLITRTHPGSYLQTPHFPPSLAQCLQYLQFLQAWQGSAPVQVAAEVPTGIWLRRRIDNKSCATAMKNFDFSIINSSMVSMAWGNERQMV